MKIPLKLKQTQEAITCFLSKLSRKKKETHRHLVAGGPGHFSIFHRRSANMWTLIRIKTIEGKQPDLPALKKDLQATSVSLQTFQKDKSVTEGPGLDGGYALDVSNPADLASVKEIIARHGFTIMYEKTLTRRLVDVDGLAYVHGDRMSVRQHYTHGGPGWDSRWHHDLFNESTSEVDCDDPMPDA